MLGIGVDDIFVICNAIDQTPLSLPASKRIRLAMRHAGPTITITSLTNAFAFLAALSSNIVALQSYSIMAFTCIIFLYLGLMSIFVPVAFWDTLRVEKRKRECFGACLCAEDSPIFCRGRLANKQQ